MMEGYGGPEGSTGGTGNLTLAQIYANGLAAADAQLTLDATRGGVVVTASALTGIVPLTVTLNNAATSGAEKGLSVTGTFNPTSGTATYNPVSVAYTVNQTGGANGAVTGVVVNATETAAGGTHKLLDLQTGGASRFSVLAAGTVASGASATLDAILAPGPTIVVSGSTAISTTAGFNYVTINPPTLSAASAAVVITGTATLYVGGPPVLAGAGPASATNLTAVRVDGTWTNTAGTGRALRFTPTFAPTSGTGVFRGIDLTYTVNQTGGANGTVTGLFLNATETAVVGTHNLVDLQVGGVSKVVVTNAGVIAGGTSASGTLTLASTTNATKGFVYLGSSTGFLYDETNKRIGIGGTPTSTIHLLNAANLDILLRSNSNSGVCDFELRNQDSTGRFQFLCYGSAVAGTTMGVNNASGNFLQAINGPLGMLTSTAADIIFGTNNVERARILSTGEFIHSSTVAGSTSSSGTLTISSTTNATKGFVYLGSSTGGVYDETNVRFGVGVAPSYQLHARTASAVCTIAADYTSTSGSAQLYFGSSGGTTFLQAFSFGSATGGTGFAGLSKAGLVSLSSTGGLFGLGTADAKDLVFGTNNAENLRIEQSSGLLKLAAAMVVANGSVATTVTSLGPTGSHTTIQEWLTFKNTSGTQRWIPCY